MAVIEYPTELSEAQQSFMAEWATKRGGRLPNAYRMMLHNPDVVSGWSGLGTALRFHGTLPDPIRELLICYVAKRKSCSYEFVHHYPVALDAGIPDLLLGALPNWRSIEPVQAEHAMTLGFSEHFLDGESVTPFLDDAVAAWGNAGVVEICATLAYYSCLADFVNALEIEDDL